MVRKMRSSQQRHPGDDVRNLNWRPYSLGIPGRSTSGDGDIIRSLCFKYAVRGVRVEKSDPWHHSCWNLAVVTAGPSHIGRALMVKAYAPGGMPIAPKGECIWSCVSQDLKGPILKER